MNSLCGTEKVCKFEYLIIGEKMFSKYFVLL
jgi:hypothetical protein